MVCEETKKAKDEVVNEQFSDRKCVMCRISLKEGWFDRCEECFDPECVGAPCLNCERGSLDAPVLLGTYYCRECREEEMKGCW